MDADDVWLRVREFARRCLATDTPIPTLDRGVVNYITKVDERSIGRRSDEGTTQTSRVTAGKVAKLWTELNGGKKANVLYFTRALVAAAVPDLVEVIDGELRLRTATDPGSVPARTGRYWAFLCNPDVYDGRRAAESLRIDRWTVPRGDPMPGDRVLIWQSKGSRNARRGIVGLAEVLSPPAEREAVPESRPFWTGPVMPRQRRIAIRYLHAQNIPLWLDDAPFLAELSVAKATGGGVFHVTEEQWEQVLARARGMDDLVAEVNGDVSASSGETSGQGFGSSAAANRAVERHAITLARAHFESRGFVIVERGKPFDLAATKDGRTIFVEVKGTQTSGRSVFLTRNEVDVYTENHPHTALYVVHGIRLVGSNEVPVAEGGVERCLEPWRPEASALEIVTWRYVLPS